MNSLYSHSALPGQLPRRRSTLVLSAVLHAALVTGALHLSTAQKLAPPDASRPPVFVAVLPVPDPPKPAPRVPLRLPPAVKEEIKLAELPPVMVEPLPEPRVEPRPERPQPPAEHRIAPPPSVPATATVKVGSFEFASTSRYAVEVSRPIQKAGFDAPGARTPDVTAARALVGIFDQPSSRPRPGTDRPNVIADAGFGTAAAPGRGVVLPGAVSAGGFDGGRGTAVGAKQGTQAVQTTEFDARATQTAAALAPHQTPTEVPLEILSKPVPAYTDEARALTIEGEVLLEVEFMATGDIRVLRVVRGLGHGLDESAARAVQAMRFKPAQRNGQPVDVRTTVNIVFRLA